VIQTAQTSRIVALLEESPAHASIHTTLLDRQAALKGFQFGKFDLVLEPNADGSVIYHYDPSRPESLLARSQIDAALQAAAGRKDALATRDQVSSEPGSRYIDFLIPGLLGMNLMNSGMWGVGFALVDMRQRKLLKRFVATPMRRSDFLLALTASRLGLMVIEVGLLLGFGVLVFHMPVLGSIATVLLFGALGAVAFGGIGLLTACRAQKIESVSGLINLVMMPMWIFSGVFFSYQHFPAVVQPLIKALPLTALNDALRSTILEGTTLAAQSGRLLVLVLWGGISFALALRWFRWT
jgi:ABC-type multidrug transport system permease subunit